MGMGKVWLIGAGPGDIGLFTIKGKEVLEKAEVVVYDSLVGQGILSQIPSSARKIFVGKRASHHTKPQEEINRILLSEAEKGFRVVRLKGGDPFLFGRGGEELELLAEKGIPYEIVPGITSPIAVPAYNGIPVTHRDFCSSLHIITGHKRAGQEYDINFKALVETKGTLVFLMGVSALGDILKGLLEAGMDPEMSAAVLSKGTTAAQKRIVATAGTLEEEAARQGIEAPAIIVVGKVCALAERFAWYEQLPLSGYKVVLTRPRHLISRTGALLREKGAEVLELPAIRTVPLEDQSPLYHALDEIGTYSWLVFTSPTGTEIFFDEMKKREQDIRSLGKIKVAAIGEGTRKKLKEHGIYADLMPETYDGDSLGEALSHQIKPGQRVLIPRAEKGNQNLTAILTAAGAEVADIPTYRTIYEASDVIDEQKEFEAGNIDCAVFTSASTVRGFVESTPGLDHTKVKAACIGKQTKAQADQYGMQTWMAEKATIESLIQLVEDMKKAETRE